MVILNYIQIKRKKYILINLEPKNISKRFFLQVRKQLKW